MIRRPLLLFLLLQALFPLTSRADADARRLPAQVDPAWRAECGGCHVLYPPGMLDAASWRKVMDGLARHFGTDASLPVVERQAITRWLVAHAGPDQVGPARLRLTETRWFLREHDELAADVWRRPGVGSAANCQACHRDAEQGGYSERQLRIPR